MDKKVSDGPKPLDTSIVREDKEKQLQLKMLKIT